MRVVGTYALQGLAVSDYRPPPAIPAVFVEVLVHAAEDLPDVIILPVQLVPAVTQGGARRTRCNNCRPRSCRGAVNPPKSVRICGLGCNAYQF
jgi:hypothetical protein